MQTLEGIRRSVATAEELQSVVKTMKAIAAAGIRQFERAVESLADYTRAIELALQALLAEEPDRLLAAAPAGAAGLGAVVFGSDQGMCGRFNQQIAAHAAAEIRAEAAGRPVSILIVGARIAPLLEAEGLAVTGLVPPASSLAGVTTLVQELLARIEQWRAGESADRISLHYNKSLGGAAYRPLTRRLFPVDLDWLADLRRRDWPTNQLPLFTIAWTAMFSSLLREFFHTAIFQAAAESLASENASRLASMQAAQRNIEDRLDVLNMHYRLRRQQSITEELLDIISGFEALAAAPAHQPIQLPR